MERGAKMAHEDIATTRVIKRTLADIDEMKRFVETAKNSPNSEFSLAAIVDEFDRRCRGWIEDMHVILERIECKLDS